MHCPSCTDAWRHLRLMCHRYEQVMAGDVVIAIESILEDTGGRAERLLGARLTTATMYDEARANREQANRDTGANREPLGPIAGALA